MCYFTFTLQHVDIFCAVTVTDELLLHTETSDVGNFFNVRQVLVFVVHPPADGALPLKMICDNTATCVEKKNKTLAAHFSPETSQYD